MKQHNRRLPRLRTGFTLVEVLIVTVVFGMLMAGVMTFVFDSAKLSFITTQKLEINGDIRDVTNIMADEAREANYFMMYSSFYSEAGSNPPGSFRKPAEGYTVEDYRQRKGSSGDFVLFVYTGIDENPRDGKPAPIERLVGYFRAGGSGDDEQAPVRRFEVEVPEDKQHDGVESLIPEEYKAQDYPNVISLVTGLANGDLFYNIEDRSVLVNGKIIHGNDAKQITGTYNFTISPRG